jgi:predicted Zn finger-like uncharacterized protein
MTISISCPACGAPYNLNDQMRGKTVRCKSCQDTFTVNGASKTGAPAAIKKGGAPAETKPAARSMPPARGGKGDPDDEPVKKKSGGKGLLIAGGIVGVLFLLCCGGVSASIYYAYTGTRDAVNKFDKDFAEAMKNGQGNPNDIDAAFKKAEEEMKKQMAQQGIKPGGDSGKKPSGDSGGKPAFPDQKQVDDAFKKLDEEMKKKGVKPGDNPFLQSDSKDIKSIDDALRDLKGADANKRRGAADWLAKATLDKTRQDEVAKALDPLILDKNCDWAALGALEVWATKENVPTLVKYLDADGQHSHKAMGIAGKLQDERGAVAVARYLPNFFAREVAVNSLRAMGPVAEKAVLKYFKHGDGGVHGAVDSLLRGYGTKASAIALQCVEDAQTATDQNDRTRVLDWLSKARPDSEIQPTVVTGLIPLLKDRNPDVASWSLRALETWGNKDSIPSIIALLDDPSPTDKAINLRRQAIDTLGRSRDERAVPAVAKRLTVEQERGNAVQALKELAGTLKPMVEAELTKYVDNDNRAVRDDATNLLKQLGSKDTGEVARRLKELKANDIGQRRDAARILAELPKADEAKKDEVSKALVDALEDPDIDVRVWATRGLGLWGTPDSYPALIKEVQSTVEQLVHWAIDSLGRLKVADAADVIGQKLVPNNDKFRQVSFKALQNIGGDKAEAAVQKALQPMDWGLCLDACKVLQVIGTKKSLKVLDFTYKGAVQAKKIDVAQAAQAAWQASKDR